MDECTYGSIAESSVGAESGRCCNRCGRNDCEKLVDDSIPLVEEHEAGCSAVIVDEETVEADDDILEHSEQGSLSSTVSHPR
jgi:hypothetical protein